MNAALLPLALLAVQSQPDRDALKKLGITIVEPMDEGATAKMRARVDAALAKAGAAQAFENVTTPTGGVVRHRASGLTCPLGERGQEVAAQPDGSALCRTRKPDVVYETRVVRGPAGATLDAVHAAAVRNAEAEPGYAPGGMMVSARPKPGSGRPEHRTIGYTSRVNGRLASTRVMVGLFDGWLLTERTTRTGARPDGFDMSDLVSEAMFGAKLKPAR